MHGWAVLEPWRPVDLKLKCQNCGVFSEDVSDRFFPSKWVGNKLTDSVSFDLCPECYDKRKEKLERN